MADDIRQLLHGAASDHARPPDFDGMWHEARRQRRRWRAGGAIASLVVLAGTALGVHQLLTSTPTLQVLATPDSCPVTIPDGGFVPPPPYLPQRPADVGVWYGSADLWTILKADGDHGLHKSVWWSQRFLGGGDEPEPEIIVTWERLDDPHAPVIRSERGTNAFTFGDGWFIIAGVSPFEPGCWRATANYRGAELSYVYLLEPSHLMRPDLLEPSDVTEVERVQLDEDEFHVLAAVATNDPSLEGHVVRETEDVQRLWGMADVADAAPMLPEGMVGVVVVARDAESTCRSTEDVVGMEIVDGVVVVVLDPDGQFLRPCPGPPGAHAFTAFAVALPDYYDDGLTGAVSRLGERPAGADEAG